MGVDPSGAVSRVTKRPNLPPRPFAHASVSGTNEPIPSLRPKRWVLVILTHTFDLR